MHHRTGRSLIIALLAALQLVLQPLAATAWCALVPVAPEGCCCGHADASAPAEEDLGCCAQKAPSSEESGDREDGPCACYTAPSQPPATHPGAPEDLRAPSAATLARVAAPIPLPWLGYGSKIVRSHAPGAGPPLHLLLQVFRL